MRPPTSSGWRSPGEGRRCSSEILNQTRVPIVADVHFHYKRALESIEAGIHKIRLNPGNISDRDQVNSVIDACSEQASIRIGVNEGSIIERKDKAVRQRAREVLRGSATRTRSR